MYSDWDTSWSVSEKVIVDTKKEEKRMNITIIAVAVTAGVFLGGTALYDYQGNEIGSFLRERNNLTIAEMEAMKG